MPALVRYAIESLLRLLAPGSCSACGEPVDTVFCAACGRPTPAGTRDIDGVPVLTAGAYVPPLSDAIRRFKFEGHPELAEPLSELLLPQVALLGIEPSDAWAPVPLHRARLVERGFNQSALIARTLASRTGSTFAPLLLERSRDTEQQARLGRAERRENAHRAFALKKKAPNLGRVILVDDVVTTGATARSCLAALREGGVEVLAVMALAHASGRS